MAFSRFTISVPSPILAYVKAEESRLGITRAEILRDMLNESFALRKAQEEEAKLALARPRKRRPTPERNGQMSLDCSSP